MSDREQLLEDLPPEPLPPALAAGAAARRELIRQSARRSLRRRDLGKKVAFGLSGLAVAVAVTPLVALAGYTTSRGIHAIGIDFFIHNPTPPGIPGGGILNAVAGSILIVGIATLLAMPVGIATALFLLERPGKLAAALRLGADVLSGVPSIAIGIFAYALIVERQGHFSGWAGAFALAVLMLPIIVRSSESAMQAVAVDLREAALALGARRSRVARSVVLRGAVAGLVTGGLLALARAVGETAPLLCTSIGSQLINLHPSAPTAAMPLVIYTNATEVYASAQQVAWGTALVLLVLVLLLNVVARRVAAGFDRRTL
ncbi:MAG: phosphate ABC transporter permease PstA [Actinomycetota bacterium]